MRNKYYVTVQGKKPKRCSKCGRMMKWSKFKVCNYCKFGIKLKGVGKKKW